MNIITAIFITVFLIIIFFGYYTYKNNLEFEEWYEKLIKMAPYYGFSVEDIQDFERGVWWVYFYDDLTVEEALKQYLLDN